MLKLRRKTILDKAEQFSKYFIAQDEIFSLPNSQYTAYWIIEDNSKIVFYSKHPRIDNNWIKTELDSFVALHVKIYGRNSQVGLDNLNKI